MSQTTVLSLIRADKEIDFNSLHQKKNYFYSTNLVNWSLVVIEGGEKDQKIWSKKLSLELQFEVICLSLNDFYLEAILYRKGGAGCLGKVG